MGSIIRFLIGALFVVGLFYAVVIGSSELAGEVVTVRTFQADGLGRETSLWIVDDRGETYLRAGTPGAEWLARLRADDRIEVVRGGVASDYRAVISDLPALRERVNQLMAEKYGWAETLLGLLRDPDQTTPIRLERVRG